MSSRSLVGALAVTAMVASTIVTSATAATTAKLNGTCAKAGLTAKAGAQSLVCTKVGSKLRWKAAPAAAAATTVAAAAAAAPATTAAPNKDAAWQDIVAKAKKEGKVTIYGSQALDALQDLCGRFKKTYGIDCEPVRLVDNDIQAKMQAERDTNKPIADVVTQSAITLVQDNSAKGWYTKPVGPSFDDKAYKREINMSKDGNFFVTSAAVLVFAWNTQLYPKGLKDYNDVLDPALKNGKVAIIDMVSPTLVDFYQYLEGRFGPTFLPRLAQQRPRIYPSALPITAALSSGEVAAAIYAQPQGPFKAQGAPTDSGIPDPLWGARFQTSIMSNAPHPNAAQVMADFMITKDGQGAITKNAGAVLPGVEGSITTTDKVKVQDLAKLTPEFVKEYTISWKALFT
jgi:iron(III) transport system substrate-binding protein